MKNKVVIKGYASKYFSYVVHPIQEGKLSIHPFDIHKKKLRDGIKVTLILEEEKCYP